VERGAFKNAGRSPTALGLDVGGANLKAVHSDRSARSEPFALWREPAGLPAALGRLCASMPAADLLAVTMTGELCDCFESKRQGVAAILGAVEAVAHGTPVRVWCNDGRFVDLTTARAVPLQAAAANWLALATFAGRHASQGVALLIDVGSTTTDLIPLHDGQPTPVGRTDSERLRSSELVYTGVRRTPLCALLNEGVAAELFATTLDVYLILGYLAERPDDCNTADGRPATFKAAEARIARMFCADLETSSAEERARLARSAAACQQALLDRHLASVLRRLPSPPRTLILAGEGEFLARHAVAQRPELAAAEIISLSRELGPAISQAACAHAVGVLAAEEV
jgi:probable H4MPT-linked C1 transfer pathway protein